jgi:hypothetical protein
MKGRFFIFAYVSLLVLSMILLATHYRIQNDRALDQSLSRSIWAQSPQTLRHRTPASWRSVTADVYWISYLQGYTQNESLDYYKQGMSLITTLDPSLTSVYWYTAMKYLAGSKQEKPAPQKALDVLEQGLKHRPIYWPSFISQAFIHVLYHHDYLKAQEILWRAMHLKNAPDYIGLQLIIFDLRTKNYEQLNQVLMDLKTRSRLKPADQTWVNELSLGLRGKKMLQYLNALKPDNESPGVTWWQYPPTEMALPGLQWLSALDSDGYAYQYNPELKIVTFHPFSPMVHRDEIFQNEAISKQRLDDLKNQDATSSRK